MSYMGRKKAVGISVATIAWLLSAVAGPSYAAQESAQPSAQRVIDFRTCAKPEYPKADLRAEHTGTVTVRFLVAPDGSVKDSKIAESSGYQSLDEAARAALATCRFAPARDANAAPLWLPVQYRWFLEGADGTVSTAMSLAAQQEAFLWTARVLARYRYKPLGQAANVDAPVLDHYLQALDPGRVLFTRSEIASLEPQRKQLARNDEARQLDAAFALFDRMRAHRLAMLAWTGEALRGPLGNLDGTTPAPRSADAPWPASDDERQALWRQRLAQEVRSLRSAGSSDKDIVATLTRRNDKRLALAQKLTTRDAFEGFMNAYVTAFDPHGAYFSPLEQASSPAGVPGHVGIGLALKKRGEWITVHEMIADGAAWRSGQLHSGDRIVGVAQAAGQPMTDVVGWGVEEVVALLRGTPGSTVVLSVSPARAQGGDPPRSVALVRGPVAGRDEARHATAKLETLEDRQGGYRIGIVTIPSFYQDFAAKRAGISDYTSMTREVAGLLATLKTQHADAVLLDMRGNGGGSLAEAIGFAGLFLPRGPVAQQRATDGRITVESASADAPVWDGLLAVLIDEGSAAATEIFAAAVQDRGRGLVIGDRSIGRSSVQTIVSLDRFAQKASVHFGELKMTVGQVYRVNGETFEKTGVVPDIDAPGLPDPSGTAHQSAFPAAPLKPVGSSPRGEVKAVVAALSRRHETRTSADTAYQMMLRARAQPSGADAAVGADIVGVQLREALQVVGDQVELLRTSPAAAN